MLTFSSYGRQSQNRIQEKQTWKLLNSLVVCLKLCEEALFNSDYCIYRLCHYIKVPHTHTTIFSKHKGLKSLREQVTSVRKNIAIISCNICKNMQLSAIIYIYLQSPRSKTGQIFSRFQGTQCRTRSYTEKKCEKKDVPCYCGLKLMFLLQAKTDCSDFLSEKPQNSGEFCITCACDLCYTAHLHLC